MKKLERNKVYTFVPNPEDKKRYGVLSDYPEDKLNDSVQFQMLFAFVRLKYAGLPKTLSIKAVHGNVEMDVELQLLSRHFYMADVKTIGKFYFCVEPMRPDALDADDIQLEMEEDQKHVKLSCLQPVNTDFFEKACLEQHFFFIGG